MERGSKSRQDVLPAGRCSPFLQLFCQRWGVGQAALRHLRLVSSTSFEPNADPFPPLYRIRKVKCDEAKPTCKRCAHTGRKCDGYAPPPPTPPATPPTNTTEVFKTTSLVVRPPKQTSPRQPDALADMMLSSVITTPEEYRSLDFFLRRTAPAISGAFDTGFVCSPLG